MAKSLSKSKRPCRSSRSGLSPPAYEEEEEEDSEEDKRRKVNEEWVWTDVLLVYEATWALHKKHNLYYQMHWPDQTDVPVTFMVKDSEVSLTSTHPPHPLSLPACSTSCAGKRPCS